MDEIQQAIKLAMQKYSGEFGEDAQMEDGDRFVTVFNNCVLVISVDDGKLHTEFTGGRPYEVDMALSIFGGE